MSNNNNNLDSDRINNFVLTYDNESLIVDGAGSQLHRIYCIYALSRFLGVSYIHSPLKKLPYQGLLNLEKNELDPKLTERYNQLFTIPSDSEILEHTKVHHLFCLKADLSLLCSLREQLKKSKEAHLFKIGWPLYLVNQKPGMLDCIKDISPFESSPSSLFRITIHVRRGELFAVDSYRMLPNSYYINMVHKIIEVLNKLGIPFVCELHTEMPSKTFAVTPSHDGIDHRIQQPVIITKEMSEITDFDIIPNLQKWINHDPIETLRSFATADLLIISRSSFSYLGAILNKRGIIVYHPFWCAAPLEWLDATHEPSFQERLLEACKKWKNFNLSTQEHLALKIAPKIPYDNDLDRNQHHA
ncbi:MAG: hypothetical protein ACOYK6_05740 [Chthoniobacterales bacterium]